MDWSGMRRRPLPLVAPFRSLVAITAGFAIFMLGFWIGNLHHHHDVQMFPQGSTHQLSTTINPFVKVSTLDQVPWRPTSHVDPQTHQAIMKQQLVEPFALPNLAGFSVAKVRPGQHITVHEHESMHELFLVWKGTGRIRVEYTDGDADGSHGSVAKEYDVSTGAFIHVSPGVKHSIWVPSEATEDLTMVVCGVITTGPKDLRCCKMSKTADGII